MFITDTFLTHVKDHLFTYWTTLFLTFFYDFHLSFSAGQWHQRKLNPRRVPDSWQSIFKIVLLNQFCVTFPTFYLVDSWFPDESIWDWRNFYKLPTAVLAVEVLFYYSHRILHIPYLYKRIHKIHHRWTSPMSISTTYCHPIEHFVANLMTIILAGYIAGLSHSALRVWHIFSLLNAMIVAHGGYRWPFYNNMHDLHHVRFECNYGVLGVLDDIHGTLQIL